MNTVRFGSSVSVTRNAWAWGPQVMIAGVCLPFIYSVVDKALNFEAAVVGFGAYGLPIPATFVSFTIAVQAAGVFLLCAMRGRWAWTGALMLAALTIVATLIAHAFWNADTGVREKQVLICVEQVAIVCGLVLAGWWKRHSSADDAISQTERA